MIDIPQDPRLLLGQAAPQQHRRGAVQHRQDIVEVVDDADDELAQQPDPVGMSGPRRRRRSIRGFGFELPGQNRQRRSLFVEVALQFGFAVLVDRDVAGPRQNLREPAVGVADRIDDDIEPSGLAVCARPLRRESDRQACSSAPDRIERRVASAGQPDFGPVAADGTLRGASIAGERPCRIDLKDEACGIEQGDAVGVDADRTRKQLSKTQSAARDSIIANRIEQ
nr:hypothetical protein [Rhodopseudomonas pseudopalustris]